jgi:hypothetical protein
MSLYPSKMTHQKHNFSNDGFTKKTVFLHQRLSAFFLFEYYNIFVCQTRLFESNRKTVKRTKLIRRRFEIITIHLLYWHPKKITKKLKRMFRIIVYHSFPFLLFFFSSLHLLISFFGKLNSVNKIRKNMKRITVRSCNTFWHLI